jgi:hypothetical protein
MASGSGELRLVVHSVIRRFEFVSDFVIRISKFPFAYLSLRSFQTTAAFPSGFIVAVI